MTRSLNGVADQADVAFENVDADGSRIALQIDGLQSCRIADSTPATRPTEMTLESAAALLPALVTGGKTEQARQVIASVPPGPPALPVAGPAFGGRGAQSASAAQTLIMAAAAIGDD